MSPHTFEARRDGWVIVTFLSTRPDAGRLTPPNRLIVDAANVRRFTGRVRAQLDASADAPSDNEISLGNGRFRVAVRVPRNKPNTNFEIYSCSAGSSGSQPPRYELAEFLKQLDSAASLAGGGVGNPPTLRRPYYASEVSCPASAKSENAIPAFPTDIPPARRALTEIGVRFVVDTTGEVEPGSFAVMPGTEPRLARAARAVIEQWKFQPSQWDALPVRQLVQRTVVFDPLAEVKGTAERDLSVRAESDGSVRFRFATSFSLGVAVYEWFHPDTVDTWANRVAFVYQEAAAVAARGEKGALRLMSIGTPAGIRYNAGYSPGDTIRHAANLVECAGSSVGTFMPPDTETLALMHAAAAQARQAKSPPANSANVAHVRVDVACPAWLPWRRSDLRDFFRVWQYPVADFPATMAQSNARAEVFASFVVDSSGRVDPRTLRVMPGSDPRAVAALPPSLVRFRFRPATRSGVRVPQVVMQAILFEPPATCTSPTSGPACTRRYTDDLNADKPSTLLAIPR